MKRFFSKLARNNKQLFRGLQAGLLTIIILAGFGQSGLAREFSEPSRLAQAATEPSCQATTTTPTWNPYPIQSNFPNPIVTSGNCQDMPMLSFFPIDTAAGNPREKTIIRDEDFSFHVYYINGANPGSPAMQSPTLKTEFVKISDTQYRLKATLTSSNGGTVTSAQEGGDLIINTPAGTRFDIVGNTTLHYPDAIERKEVADNTGERPYDQVPDNSASIDRNSNAIYTKFDSDEVQLTSTNGFVVKPNGLEAGFLGYGYVLSTISARVGVEENNPPQIPGQEITIIRGDNGSFTGLIPTDPDGDYPITLNLAEVLPSFCRVTGTANAQGGGQIITCQSDANTPVRTEFVITPTDSRGLVGTPGTYIVNIIDPKMDLTKVCYKKGTQNQCKNTALKVGDEVTYEVTATNPGTVELRQLNIIDTYDKQKLTDIKQISDNGQLNATAGTITWANLGNLAAGQSKKVTFDAKIAQAVAISDTIINTVKATAQGVPEKQAQADFTVGGDLGIIKECYAGAINGVDALNRVPVQSSATSSRMSSSSTVIVSSSISSNNSRSTSSVSVNSSRDVRTTQSSAATAQNTNTPCKQAQLKAGDLITYVIKVTNSTTAEAKNVIVTDTYDKAKISNISLATDSGQINQAAGTIVWNLGNMASGSSKEVSVVGIISDTAPIGSIINNIAVVKADGIPEKRAEVDFPIGGAALVPQKVCFRKNTQTQCKDAKMMPNETVVYKIMVQNSGNRDATNVTVVDNYDETRLASVSAVNPQGTVDTNAGTITWMVGTIPAGQARELTFEAKIKDNVTTGTIINNIAVVKADGFPDQTVTADFPIMFIVSVTPRTGGGMALALLVFMAATLAGGFYYYKKNNKFASEFTPARSTETGSDEKPRKHKVHSKPKKKDIQ